jgi:hypothetical protein
VRKLIDTLQDVLAQDSNSLTAILPQAIRLATLTDSPEYRLLFEMHLNGVPNPKDGSVPAVTPWPDQARVPKFDIVKASLDDRLTSEGLVQSLSVAEIELTLRETRRIRTQYPDEVKLLQQERELARILARIRHRVALFVNTLEAASLERKPSKQAEHGMGVFIGHGRSHVWRELKDFLSETLGLRVIEFNREPTAGISTAERLAKMLADADFAFLVLTAEDPRGDGRLHARENVVHEAGLFQGKLGFKRAIVVLEDGCEEFSNISGLGQIRFPVGRISAAFEDVRRVLIREGIVASR